jgi:hypothetical protein
MRPGAAPLQPSSSQAAKQHQQGVPRLTEGLQNRTTEAAKEKPGGASWGWGWERESGSLGEGRTKVFECP